MMAGPSYYLILSGLIAPELAAAPPEMRPQKAGMGSISRNKAAADDIILKHRLTMHKAR